eukprot:5443893-Pleurochrysis_carterae.AAC.2
MGCHTCIHNYIDTYIGSYILLLTAVGRFSVCVPVNLGELQEPRLDLFRTTQDCRFAVMERWRVHQKYPET